ncbi:MAG: signal peptidase I [Treponema sp.]|nr:signal peptidase I [Treponema sp.]
MNRKQMPTPYQIKKAKQRKVFFIFLYAVFLFGFINIIMTYLVFPVKQKSLSMIPDVLQDSVVMVSPIMKNYERSDVVLLGKRVKTEKSLFSRFSETFVSFFTGKQVFLSEDAVFPGTKQKLRRVIGVPGDTIYMRDYVVYIKPMGEKHFLTEFEITPKTYNVTFFTAPAGWDSSLGVKGSFEEITLGPDEYFVLGDNRKSTDDSRLWGIVNKDDIDAKALFCYLPFKNFKLY